MADTPLPDLSAIYSDYYARVVAYATRLLGPNEAADVAQDVFIKVGRSLDTLADPSKLAPWIYAITLNTVRDTARKRTVPDRLAANGLTAGKQPGAEGSGELPDMRSRTPEEIVERNEMVALVKIRLHRARARLHDELRRNCQCYRNARGELMGEPRRV